MNNDKCLMIVNIVCNFYNVSKEDAISKLRKKDFVNCRHMIFYMCRKHTKMAYEKIGELVNRNHATIMHGEKKIKNELEFYRDLQEDVNSINLLITYAVKAGNKIIPTDLNLLHIAILNKKAS